MSVFTAPSTQGYTIFDRQPSPYVFLGSAPGLMSNLAGNQGGLQANGMVFLSPKSFEHLLFEMHPSVYREIDRQLQVVDRRYPGALSAVCKIYESNFYNPTTRGAAVCDAPQLKNHLSFDVNIKVNEREISKVSKCKKAKVTIVAQRPDHIEARNNPSGNHLIVTLKAGKIPQSFIVPLSLVLKVFEGRVCKPDTYQVYEHNLIKQKEETPTTQIEYQDGSGQYVGLTSRTWQQRYSEHDRAAQGGSQLLFHCALREERFEIAAHEHIVLRAGLSRKQALHVEEVEVEDRTLHGIHPNGLNMIPGGEAGLRFLATMTKRPASSFKIDEVEDVLKEAVNRNLRQSGLGLEGEHCNAKLVTLWATDIEFRIRAMTNQANRLSYRQIRCARIWHASEWSMDKIVTNLNGMDGRAATHDQVQRLLDGKCYATIPHILIPLKIDPSLDQ